MSKLEEVRELVIAGKAKQIAAATQGALDEGHDANVILNTMIDAMGVVGERFRTGEIFVPEMLVAARAMKKSVDVLKPHLASGTTGAAGKVIIGTVAGDLHDIGKNLVALMMESTGFEVIDLGIDVPIQTFIDTYNENPDTKIIACSALLTTTMGEMRNVVDAVEASEMKGKVKIMIGGAPITQAFCDQIGADKYTPDAASAADVALAICTA